MALQHAASGDKIALARDDGDIAFFTSVALAKTPNMELIRLVLPKERPMPEHWVDGDMTLQCLEGKIEVDAHGRTVALAPGEMLYLAGGVPHSVRAVEDAVALMTILLTHQFTEGHRLADTKIGSGPRDQTPA
jgi:quercetin dioxygenase-like cupin family protein